MKYSKNKFWILPLFVSFFCILISIGEISFAQVEGHWAEDAVNTLNDIYEEDVFYASDDVMESGDLEDILVKTGWQYEEEIGDDFTRAKACEILANIFSLPVNEDESAIEYLFRQGIINGYAPDNDLDEDGDVTLAQFAILSYRVLRATGGILGTQTEFKIGTEEYFAYSYLRVRMVEVKTEEYINEDIWVEWNETLKTEYEYPYGEEEDDIPQVKAAVKLVKEFIEAGDIFSDVSTSDYFYDGVMYLFDKGIINGEEGGTFNPNGEVNRMTFAVLLSRFANYDDVDISDVSVNAPEGIDENYIECMKKAIAKGCMVEDENDPETWWTEELPRGEAIIGIMRAVDTDVEDVNMSVLERFNDVDEFSDDVSPYIVYSVMIGLVKGYEDGSLGLYDNVSRAQIGVLLYRTLIGVDNTKMQDYREIVDGTLNINQE